MNDKIEKLKLNNLASPQHRDLPNLSFGSVSLSSTIKSKAETTKYQSKPKIEFNTIQNPISPKNDKLNDSALNFYASPENNSSGDRTITEMGNDKLAKIPLDDVLEEQEAKIIQQPKHKR